MNLAANGLLSPNALHASSPAMQHVQPLLTLAFADIQVFSQLSQMQASSSMREGEVKKLEF